MAESWALLLARLRRAYKAAGLNCGDAMCPPARTAAINAASKQLGVAIPSSLKAVWRVYGGQRSVSPGVHGLFGKHRLHTPTEAVVNYQMFCEYNLDKPGAFPPRNRQTCYFDQRLLPFASWDIYNLCIDTETGAVWDFSPNFGMRGGTSRPSLRDLVLELLTMLRAGDEPDPDFIYGPKRSQRKGKK